jgi:hypothetical protein
MNIETVLTVTKDKELRRSRLEQAAKWLGVAASSMVLAASNLSTNASAETNGQKVKESPRVNLANGTIKIEGKPFFPIMSWAQSQTEVEDNLDIGVNTFMGVDGNQQKLVDEIDGRAYVVSRFIDDNKSKQNYYGEIGQHLPDEADGYGILPEDLPKTRRVEETGRLIFQTLTFHYSAQEAKITRKDGRVITDSDYRDYINNADVIGTDLYPMSHGCLNPNFGNKPGGVYDYQKELTELAGSKPTYQWIEVNQIEGDCGDNPVTPQITRAEVYLAIAGGADGIGYFTYGWDKGKMNRFDVDSAMRITLKKLSREIETLTPVLLAPEIPIAAGKKAAIKIGGRDYKGEYYMLAVNSTNQPVIWNRKLTNLDLGNQKLAIYNSKQFVKAKNGWVSDRFEPYEVKIYHWTPPS